MEQDVPSRGERASVAMTALKLVVAAVFIVGMTFALVIGYAHFDEGSETPRFEEAGELRSEVVGNWENPGPNHDEYDRSEIERLVVEYTNEERAAEGLSELEQVGAFTSVAREHSADMANHGYVGHVDSQGRRLKDRIDNQACIDEAGVDVDAENRRRDAEVRPGENEVTVPVDVSIGENAGTTFYETPVKNERIDEAVTNENEDDIARTLVDSWMASPPHRENILSEEWEVISVGVYVSEGKTVFATQVFCGAQASS